MWAAVGWSSNGEDVAGLDIVAEGQTLDDPPGTLIITGADLDIGQALTHHRQADY